MKSAFILPLTFLALTVPLLAQTTPPATVAVTVPTGKPRQVGFFAPINPDCTTAGDTDTRIVKQPQNGTVEVEAGSGFAVYPEKNPRSACNAKQLQGIRIKYQSKEAYIGKDTFEVEFLSPNGGDVIWKYAVTVK
jgi:hypothetical protein